MEVADDLKNQGSPRVIKKMLVCQAFSVRHKPANQTADSSMIGCTHKLLLERGASLFVLPDICHARLSFCLAALFLNIHIFNNQR